jgi:hypothetical protein
MFIVPVHIFGALVTAVTLSCGQVLPCDRRLRFFARHPVAYKRLPYRSVHALYGYGRRPQIPASVSGTRAIPCDPGLVIVNAFGEYTVCCMR